MSMVKNYLPQTYNSIGWAWNFLGKMQLTNYPFQSLVYKTADNYIMRIPHISRYFKWSWTKKLTKGTSEVSSKACKSVLSVLFDVYDFASFKFLFCWCLPTFDTVQRLKKKWVDLHNAAVQEPIDDNF